MAATIQIFGHKNPDNDAISAAVAYAYLKNQLAAAAGEDAVYEACCLGALPADSQKILADNGLDAPRQISAVEEGQKVI